MAKRYKMVDVEGKSELQVLVQNEWKTLPTAAFRILLLEEVHIVHLHVGAPKMLALLQKKYYWPDMQKDCVNFVRNCFCCQLTDQTIAHPKWSNMLPLPPGPRHTWSLDLMTDLPQTPTSMLHVLLAVDLFTKYVVIVPLPNRTSACIADAIQAHLIAYFGPPAEIRTDNGREFKG